MELWRLLTFGEGGDRGSRARREISATSGGVLLFPFICHSATGPLCLPAGAGSRRGLECLLLLLGGIPLVIRGSGDRRAILATPGSAFIFSFICHSGTGSWCATSRETMSASSRGCLECLLLLGPGIPLVIQGSGERRESLWDFASRWLYGTGTLRRNTGAAVGGCGGGENDPAGRRSSRSGAAACLVAEIH